MESIPQLLPYSVSQALGWTVLHSLWQAMLIGLFTAAVLIAARRKSAVWRYRVAGIGLGLVLAVAVGTFCYYFFGASQPTVPVATDAIQSEATADLLPQEYLTPPVLSAEATPLHTRIGHYFEGHLPLIALIWLFGFALFLLRLLLQVSQIYYLKTRLNFPPDEYWTELKDALWQKSGLLRAVGLAESAMVRTPVVVGHLKPLILFPVGLINRLDPAEVEAILAHEIAHVIRQDYLFNILQSVVESIFYYHPAVWWLSAAMRREREMATDSLAIALTGNAVRYAKALVLIQELAYFPLSPALAFAGARKSQLFTRVQHILKIKHSTSLAMEKFISAAAFCLLLVGLVYAQSGSLSKSGQPNQTSEKPNWTAADSTAGIWEGELKNNELCLTMTRRAHRSHWSTHECYPLSAFSALPNGNGAFTMTREAGTITFKGSFEGREGFGRFTFQENPAFRKMLENNGIAGVEDHMLIHFCLNNVTGSYITFLKQKGYQKIDADDLVGLAVHGLDQQAVEGYLDLFAKKGKKDVKLEDLMSFKIHNITEVYIDSLMSMGLKNLSLDDVMAAKIHGINARFVQQYKSMNPTVNLDFDQILSYKIHGITPEYAASLDAAGFKGLDSDDVMAFKIHGITPEYAASLQAAGFKGLDNDDVVAFKIHGVTPEYAAALQAAGLNGLSNDDLLSYKIHGITPEYLSTLKASGFNNLSNDDLLSYKIHNITPEYAASLKAAGITGLDNDEIVAFKIHGITPEIIADYRKMGFPNLDTGDLMAFKIHGIDAAFVQSFESVFPGKKLDSEEVVSLKIHGITPDWIRRAREKGFTDMTVDEYIQLKIQFGDKVR
jgi:beta-lactamase regulating signal transducer with metallopeptidase domain